MHKLTKLSVIPMMLLVSSAMADNQNHNEPNNRYEGIASKAQTQNGIPQILKGINLSDEQQSEIKKLVEAQQTNNKNELKSHRELRQKFARLSFNDALDQEKLESIVNEATEAHAARLIKKAKLNNAIFNVLNEAQQQQLQQKMSESENW